jgi:hypothetical protein
MTITIGSWIIPFVITGVFLGIMLRPYKRSGDYDFGSILRGFWLILILAVWVIYLLIIVALK